MLLFIEQRVLDVEKYTADVLTDLRIGLTVLMLHGHIFYRRSYGYAFIKTAHMFLFLLIILTVLIFAKGKTKVYNNTVNTVHQWH